MARTIDVQSSSSQPIELRDFELCEHKGIGHPDTITDGICEAASRELSRRYQREFGRVLHHNLDKGLLLAGRSEPRFGGGRILEPMKFLICGRATPMDGGEDPAAIAIAAARAHLKTHIGFEAAANAITAHIGPTSDSLQRLFAPNPRCRAPMTPRSAPASRHTRGSSARCWMLPRRSAHRLSGGSFPPRALTSRSWDAGWARPPP